MVLAEVVKRWFYKRHSYRIEQVLVPKKRGLYLNRTARLVQDVVAVICLRVENEISIDSLFEDLTRSINYRVTQDQVMQSLQYLRRGGLISIDWHGRRIKRESPMKGYVTTRIMTGEMWPLIYEDWLKTNKAIQDKYGRVNTEYQALLSQTELR